MYNKIPSLSNHLLCSPTTIIIQVVSEVSYGHCQCQELRHSVSGRYHKSKITTIINNTISSRLSLLSKSRIERK